MTYIIGMTGGIGSGKSSAARLFAERGAGIVDTDDIARELTASGQPALAQIRAEIGAQFFTPDGELDRARLRQHVFNVPAARTTLENILHPMIRVEAARRCARSPAPYTLLIVPLLLESNAYHHLIERILVVDCPEMTQIQRVMARSGLAEAEVQAIIARQISRIERCKKADDIIENNGDLAHLAAAVQQLHDRYIKIAGQRASGNVCQTGGNASQ